MASHLKQKRNPENDSPAGRLVSVRHPDFSAKNSHFSIFLPAIRELKEKVEEL